MASAAVEDVSSMDVPAAPTLTKTKSGMSNPVSDANNVMSGIHAENTTQVDQGKAVPEAKGIYECKRVGEIQFRFKSAHMFSASTVSNHATVRMFTHCRCLNN